jgi:hypothetical protein
MTRRQDAPSNAIERHTGDDDGDDIDGDNGNDEDDATDLGEIRLQCPRSEVAALVAGKHIPLPGMITNLQSATARRLTLQPAMHVTSKCGVSLDGGCSRSTSVVIRHELLLLS